MSVMGTSQKLDAILQTLVRSTNGIISNCVVTNDRGLIVSFIGKKKGYENLIAAMSSLLSDTANRISKNIELDGFRVVYMEGNRLNFILHEFPVEDKRFRICVTAKPEGKIRGMLQRLRKKTLLDSIKKAAGEIQRVLEEH